MNPTDIPFQTVCDRLKCILNCTGKNSNTRRREEIKNLISLCHRDEIFSLMRLIIPEVKIHYFSDLVSQAQILFRR